MNAEQIITLVCTTVGSVVALIMSIINYKRNAEVKNALKTGNFYIYCPKCNTEIALKDVEVKEYDKKTN